MLEKSTSAPENQLSKEEYLIRRAKDALSTDIHAAKSWLITAKSLFPHSAKIQFEAYRIEKQSKNVKEAAKCFSEAFQNFPDDREIWKEIETITTCLRFEPTNKDGEFLCEMFQHIPQDLQHKLLIMTAEHSEDPMEHCNLLLILLKRFPQTIPSHGPGLLEILLTAEKHSHLGVAVNGFRRLLACEALPLLSSSTVELNPRLSLRVLCKTIEFYLAHLQQPHVAPISNPWEKLFQVVEVIGRKLGWELSSMFLTPWNRDLYCDRLVQYAQHHAAGLGDEVVVRQFLKCTIVVLIRILDEHSALMKSDEASHVLVEAFVDSVPAHNSVKQLKKRKKGDPPAILITSDQEYSGYGLALAVKLYDLLHSTEYLQRETLKVIQQMHLETWLDPFLVDLTLYKGMHHDIYSRFNQGSNSLTTNLRYACTCYFLKDYKNMLEYIIMVANALPTHEGKASPNLSMVALRHLHYLTMARFPVLQYCCRLLLGAIKDLCAIPGTVGDLAIGHTLVLMQIDWPQQITDFTLVMKTILSRRSFSYPLFQAYIINVDILEELTYLWTEHGGGVALDIAVNTGILQNRRISTRGADKGVKEEVKQTMRRQAARDGVDALDELILRFILNEKNALQHCLLNAVR